MRGRCADPEAAKKGHAEGAEIAKKKTLCVPPAISALKFLCVPGSYQKSNCALSLNRRGSRIDCGVLHAGPNVLFSVSTEFEFKML